MKKISKFRKWLITKLGGITPDQKIEPKIIFQERAVKELNVSIIAHAYESKDETMMRLNQELLNAIAQYVQVYTEVDIGDMYTRYTARIKVVE